MAGDLIQHMIEKRYSAIQRRVSAAIEIHPHGDARLERIPGHFRCSFCHDACLIDCAPPTGDDTACPRETRIIENNPAQNSVVIPLQSPPIRVHDAKE